jgi:endogenous inhibitor of DNA gyrase (YacG/DUF329 family)
VRHKEICVCLCGCGTKFERWPSQNGKYVSQEHRRNGNWYACEVCGKLKYVQPSMRERGIGRYCSDRCRIIDNGGKRWASRIVIKPREAKFMASIATLTALAMGDR